MKTLSNTPPKIMKKSFGMIFPNHIFTIGTKDEVEIFFRVLNDLISRRVIDDSYPSISHDLYCSLINSDNFEKFKKEYEDLKCIFSKISSDSIDRGKHQLSLDSHVFESQHVSIEITKRTLLEVFERFFIGFEKAVFWINESILRNGKYSRLIIAPTTIEDSRRFKMFSDYDFKSSSDNPLWLQEPE